MIVNLEDVTYYKIASRNLLINVNKEEIDNNFYEHSESKSCSFLQATNLTNIIDIAMAGFKKETVPEYMFFKKNENNQLVEFFTGLPLGNSIFCYQKELDQLGGPDFDVIQKVRSHDEIYRCLRNFTSKELGTELLEVVEKYKKFYKSGKNYQDIRVMKQLHLRNLFDGKIF